MGGVAGHMQHIYDDLNRTFGDIKRDIDSLLKDGPRKYKISLKVDGLNIFFTMIDGRVAIARNKSQLRNPLIGEDAIESFFEQLPHVAEAYVWAVRKIAEGVEDIFENGRFWINAELVYRRAPNVIAYTHDLIVLHSLVEVRDGKIVSRKRIESLRGIVRNVNKRARDLFRLSFLGDFDVTTTEEDRKEIMRYIDQISGGKDNMTLWEWFLEGLINDMGLNENDAKRVLYAFERYSSLRRLSGNYNIIALETYLRRRLDKLVFLEQLILAAIAESIYQVAKGLLAVDKDAKAILRKLDRLDFSGSDPLTLARNEHMLKVLTQQLANELQPINLAFEGIVVEDEQGNVYKITGLFRYLNRLLWFLKE